MTNSVPEKVIYFVRHGQSEANVAPVFQSPDSPLNEKGRSQTSEVANRISKISFDVLIASPFRRARETAEVISKVSKKEVIFSDLFIERVKPDSLNDKPYDDKEADSVWREWERSLFAPGLKVENGENYDDLIARADKALAFLYSRPEKVIVVVTHGFFLRTIIARVLLGESLSSKTFRNFQGSIATENTGVTVLKYQDGFEEGAKWRLWIYNDHAHLAE